ncbi:hypothetical protein LguiB_017437 [Lonicera macranthoides]
MKPKGLAEWIGSWHERFQTFLSEQSKLVGQRGFWARVMTNSWFCGSDLCGFTHPNSPKTLLHTRANSSSHTQTRKNHGGRRLVLFGCGRCTNIKEYENCIDIEIEKDFKWLRKKEKHDERTYCSWDNIHEFAVDCPTSSLMGGFKLDDYMAIINNKIVVTLRYPFIMKRIQRYFGRSSVSNPPEEGGSSTQPARPSSARRRSTERRSEPENEGGSSTQAARPSTARRRSSERRSDTETEGGPSNNQGASSSSPFANYKRVVDDSDHISKMKRTREGSLFYIRSTWHTARNLYKDLIVNPEVQMLLDNTGLCDLFKREMPNSDRTVVEACCRRWWDTTHTFHLPTCELGFTPLDFTMLTDRPSIEAPPAMTQSRGTWRNAYIDAMNCANQLKYQLFMHSADMAQQLKEKDRQILEKDAEIERLRENSQSMDEEIEEKWREIIASYEQGGRISPHVFATKNLWKYHLSRWVKKKIKLYRTGGKEWVDNFFWKYVPTELLSTLLENPEFDPKYRLLPSLAERTSIFVLLQQRAEEIRRRMEHQRELRRINPGLIFNEDIFDRDWEDHAFEEYEIEESKTYPDDVSSSDEGDG